MAKTREEWTALLARLEHSAENHPDPSHRKWCRGQARVVKRKMTERFS